MPRALSSLAPGWWDYTTLDRALIADAAALTPEKLRRLSRPGFKVVFYDTLEDFYCAEALEYIHAWQQATPDNPAGICGSIGPTEQLPLVARIANEIGLKLHDAHFWGMDEWVIDGASVPDTHPLPRRGQYRHAPPPATAYRQLTTRVVDLHPVTIAQNARTSGGGNVALVPTQAVTVGPAETWKAEKVSLWHARRARQPLRPAPHRADDRPRHR